MPHRSKSNSILEASEEMTTKLPFVPSSRTVSSLTYFFMPATATAPAGSSIAQSPPALYPRFELEYVEPHIHKWYEPGHLPETYWRPWYSGATSYARQPYSRYVNRLLEGDDFYDVFGQPIGRGWLVYTWTQSQPQASGSQLICLSLPCLSTFVETP